MTDAMIAERAREAFEAWAASGEDQQTRWRRHGPRVDEGFIAGFLAGRASGAARIEALESAGRMAFGQLCRANEGAFKNGVVDSTGSIDEGEVFAGHVIDALEAVLGPAQPSAEMDIAKGLAMSAAVETSPRDGPTRNSKTQDPSGDPLT